MFRASFGPPPENPDEIIWVSLRDMIDIQGRDPKKWNVKPYCPHCKCALHAHDVKGLLGWGLVAKEVSERRPSPGFHHPNHAAKSDCPHSFANDPRYAPEEEHHDKTTNQETERNKIRLYEPRMARANGDILNFLMYGLTGQEVLSRYDEQLAKVAAAKIITTPGLADYPWLMPYMQVMMLGTRRRLLEKKERIATDGQQVLEQGEFFDQQYVGRRKSGTLHEVIYNNVGSRALEFRDVNGHSRSLMTPEALILCTVVRNGGEVRYEPIERGKKRNQVITPVSRDVAYKIALEAKLRRQSREILIESMSSPYDRGDRAALPESQDIQQMLVFQ